MFYFLRAITKTAVSSELRTEVEENQKVITKGKKWPFCFFIVVIKLRKSELNP